MKALKIVVISIIIGCFCVNALAKNKKPGLHKNANVRFQQIVEHGIFCNGYQNLGELPEIGNEIGFESEYYKYTKDGGAIGYEGYLVRKTGTPNIFGFPLMAVFVEPHSAHFLALVNASKEDVLNLVKKKLKFNVGSIITEYNKIYEGDEFHEGKHMDDGGYNSNRRLYKKMLPDGRKDFDYFIEIESCDETKSPWFKSKCAQFDQKPLTWVGCMVGTEHYSARFIFSGRGVPILKKLPDSSGQQNITQSTEKSLLEKIRDFFHPSKTEKR